MPQSRQQIISQLEKQFCHETGTVTLDMRNSDSLDFKEYCVADIRKLIERAFAAGCGYGADRESAWSDYKNHLL